jgi:hypothetical protein
LVETFTPQGSPLGASIEWTLPDLTGFDVDSVHVRIVQVTPRSEVFSSALLPVQTTGGEPPSGVFQYGVEYIYSISLIDFEGSNTENRSGAQSQPFRYALPGDFDLDGAVGGADLLQWQSNFGQNGDSDADSDGDSDGADFLAWQQLGAGNLLSNVSATRNPVSQWPGHVPEPAAIKLVAALAAAGMLMRQRTRAELAAPIQRRP